MEYAREVRADRYGIRTFLKIGDRTIKVQIVSEGRITLDPGADHLLNVPVLSRTDFYAEKLLANADLWNDLSQMSRDIIDLAMMIDNWGEIPLAAQTKAREAYGDSIDAAYNAAIARISDASYLRDCVHALSIDEDACTRIYKALGLSWEPGYPDAGRPCGR